MFTNLNVEAELPLPCTSFKSNILQLRQSENGKDWIVKGTSWLCSWPPADATCVLDSDFGFILNCGFKKSGLFRVRNLGGVKGYVGVGFSVGDELRFNESLSNVEPSNRRRAVAATARSSGAGPAPALAIKGAAAANATASALIKNIYNKKLLYKYYNYILLFLFYYYFFIIILLCYYYYYYYYYYYLYSDILRITIIVFDLDTCSKNSIQFNLFVIAFQGYATTNAGITAES
ncbi:Uncharacterized protein GBIM_07388 [Gryllus bimaculatus]|nr:Uncharacterized protein GBIM_07388 [Gryllus bimaculatus]